VGLAWALRQEKEIKAFILNRTKQNYLYPQKT